MSGSSNMRIVSWTVPKTLSLMNAGAWSASGEGALFAEYRKGCGSFAGGMLGTPGPRAPLSGLKSRTATRAPTGPSKNPGSPRIVTASAGGRSLKSVVARSLSSVHTRAVAIDRAPQTGLSPRIVTRCPCRRWGK